MKKLIAGGTVCAGALVVAAILVPAGIHGEPQSPDTENVIVVVIDGLRCYEAFHDSPASDYVRCMRDSLDPYATRYQNFWNNGVTQTLGGHLTLGTGTWQLMPNSLTYFGPDEDTVSTQPDKPTLFEYYNKAKGYGPSDNKAVYVGGKSWNDTLMCSVDPEYGRSDGGKVVIFPPHTEDWENVPGDTATYRVLINSVLGPHHPNLVLVNFKDVDKWGHKADTLDTTGTDDDYYRAIEVANSLVWELWKWIQGDATYAGKTTLIVTTDHGRHDDQHGGFWHHGGICHGCRHTFLIAAGPDTPSNTVVTRCAFQIDICPTVGELLGFWYPHARGSALSEMLDFDLSHQTGTNYGAGSGDVRVTSTDSISVSPQIASSSTGDTLHVVYVDKSAGKCEVKYKRSTNLGTSWGPDSTLSTGDELDSQLPSVCVLGDTVDVVWMGCNWHTDPTGAPLPDSVPRWYLYHCRSTNAGGSWGTRRAIQGSKYEQSPVRDKPSWSIWDPSVSRYGSSVVGISVCCTGSRRTRTR
ncbi:hypothetical protein AMJ39_09285 [candidate division TA06 bacterium DG_24]|uniref:Metalloenzyme domain-containing protein n=1 Tax=candidate division TA06 bacterium DG_24 TaxID=1703770 RepID=A0A0S7WNR2_UNCT6|nr:MAG: hypothetical protein AMJ39_09285 [candidate division TA06 bacterium DG_24]